MTDEKQNLLMNDTIAHIDNKVNENSSSNELEEVSIYSIRTKFQRYAILAVAAFIAALLPFSDSVYLPAVNQVEIGLNASATLVSVSVSVYLFMSAVFCLVWGSVADRYGRKITVIIALIIFAGASLICIFTVSIVVLIVFRAIEGGAVSATFVSGLGFVADTYPEETRGTASGFFMLAFNIGPVVGPMIGGPLEGAFGWPSAFIVLTSYAVIGIIALFIFVPETHQYFAKERFHKANPGKRIIDAEPNEKPLFKKPWKSLVFLTDLTIIPYVVSVSIIYGSLYTSFTLYSIYLSQPPYNYTETVIGLLYIPSGVGLFTGSLLGGWLSDKTAKYFGYEKCYEGRLLPGLFSAILCPIGLLLYGWIFHYRLNVAGPIIGQILLSFGEASIETTVAAYLTIKKQRESSMIAGASTFCNLLAAAVLVNFAVPMDDAMGTGPYFSFLTALNVISIAWASILAYRKIRQAGYIPT